MTSNALVQFKLKPHPNLSLSLARILSSLHSSLLISHLIPSLPSLSVATNQAGGVWRPAELTAGEKEERGAGEQEERGAGAQV